MFGRAMLLYMGYLLHGYIGCEGFLYLVYNDSVHDRLGYHTRDRDALAAFYFGVLPGVVKIQNERVFYILRVDADARARLHFRAPAAYLVLDAENR